MRKSLLSIGIVYEHAETDEMGIKATAKEMGIDVVYFPFRKVCVSIANDGYQFKTKGKNYTEALKDIRVVLNRTQSKNRRLYAGSILEACGKNVINPFSIEYVCYSKLRTLLRFWKAGIRIPQTLFIPCDAHDRVSGSDKTIHNEEDIADLIENALGQGRVVIKPDAGTHGRMVRLATNRKELTKLVDETESSVVNPVGLVAQEFVDKWFFDLRIIVAKKSGSTPYCYPTALARAGFSDFRTNTYLGNMVFGVDLPREIMDFSVRCGEAVAQDKEAWVLALDAMLNIRKNKSVDDDYVKTRLERLREPFQIVKEAKRKKMGMMDFAAWNDELESAYRGYMNSDAYASVREVIEENIERSKHSILFHEANACPEFWEQTRVVAGINIAETLLECAQSVIENPCSDQSGSCIVE